MGTAVLVAIFVGLLVAILFSLFLWGKEWRAAEERARERRLAGHRMNARLLRLDI